MFYTPNLKNDAHDTNVQYTVKYLRDLVDTMRSNKAFIKDTLILITFVENGKSPLRLKMIPSNKSLTCLDIYDDTSYGTNNDTYTVLLGDDVVSCTGCVAEQFYKRQ